MSERRGGAERSIGGSEGTAGGGGDRPTGGGVAEAVVEATAEATGTDPLAMDPLYNAVDPDGLESLVGGPSDGANAMVSFNYEGCRVTVYRGGRVEVETP